MKICSVVVGDGRIQYLRQAVASYHKSVINADDYLIMINDTGDSGYARVLDDEFPEFKIIHHPERRGLGGAVRSAWTEAVKTGCDFVFHVEEDFIFPDEIDAFDLVKLLVSRPHLAQMCLVRNAVNDQESAAGGMLHVDPSRYTECSNGQVDWLEQSSLFSFNPALISIGVIEHALHTATDFLERDVTDVLTPQGYAFGLLGKMSDDPRCIHIGTQHSSGYRW